MRKLFFTLALFATGMSFGQIYTPSGAVNATTNPTSGNVGIGTAAINPNEKLTVAGTINAIKTASGEYPRIGFNTDDHFQDPTGVTINNYGMSYSAFDTSSGYPTVSFSGWRGINFYTNQIERMKINSSGVVGIGVTTFPTATSYSNYKLFVTGGILTDEIRVKLSSGGTWADYVFADNYKLKPLAEVEAFVAKNKHLPNVPSAAQVKEEGINIAEMARIQQEKIEELMLYIIQQEKRIEALESKIGK